MIRSTTPRIVAAVASVAITFSLFEGVTSLAEPQHAAAVTALAHFNPAVAIAPVSGTR